MNPKNNFNYYEFRKNSIVETINRELVFYNDCDSDLLFYDKCFIKNKQKTYKDNYIYYLIDRIREDSKPVNPKFDLFGNIKNIEVLNIENDMNEVYSKPWTKLSELHKLLKIKEFVGKLKYRSLDVESKQENKDMIYKELEDGFKSKKYVSKKNKIEWDTKNKCIINIPRLFYDKQKDIYYLDW
jgi:hypothetical protein